MSDLKQMHCVACEGGAQPLGKTEITDMLAKVPGWEVNEYRDRISREVSFKNYYETMAFVNAVAWMAHQENHHPDLVVSYNRCVVNYNTHAIGGLSENDFICAARVNEILD